MDHRVQNLRYDLKRRLSKELFRMESEIKILIAEDEAIFALSMKSVLTRLGYGICGLVSTAEEAVAKVKQEKPDLVILDVTLNGRFNGIEAAKEIRSRSDIPIIFITGYEEEKLIERIESVPSSVFLIKPITPKDLESAISQVRNDS